MLFVMCLYVDCKKMMLSMIYHSFYCIFFCFLPSTNCGLRYQIAVVTLTWALSKGPNRMSPIPHMRTETNSVSKMCSLNQKMDKVQKANTSKDVIYLRNYIFCYLFTYGLFNNIMT